MNLPGWPVEPWQLHPRFRRLGYGLREEEDVVHLVFGGEEIVATFQTKVATVRLLDMEIERDLRARERQTVELDRWAGFSP